MNFNPLLYVFALLLSLAPLHAHAYIGPGMGLGVAATVLGLFVAFVLLLVGLIWLPIRRFMRKRKQGRQVPPAADTHR